MSNWITDRRPTEEDASNTCVWVMRNGVAVLFPWQEVGVEPIEPWMPIAPPEPYVKPKRWRVSSAEFGDYVIYDAKFCVYMTPPLPTREAAERIAAIYEEVMP